MKTLYFASLREKMGKSEEDLTPPREIRTVGELIGWLRQQGPDYFEAFSSTAIRVAVNRTHVKPDALIDQNGEIAFFPPMTGG